MEMPQKITQKLLVRFQTPNRTQSVKYLPPAKPNSRPSQDEREQTQKAGNNTKEKELYYWPTNFLHHPEAGPKKTTRHKRKEQKGQIFIFNDTPVSNLIAEKVTTTEKKTSLYPAERHCLFENVIQLSQAVKRKENGKGKMKGKCKSSVV